jgi:hypothetical protein
MITTVQPPQLKRILGIPLLRTDIVECPSPVTPRGDAALLYRIARSLSPSNILEIGTYRGDISLGLALNCPSATVFTIDICREMGIEVPESQQHLFQFRGDVGKAFAGKGLNIVQIFRDSRAPSSYHDLLPLDLSFIDGNHSFDAIVADSLNVLSASRNGATIVWHDYKDDLTVSTIQALHYVSRMLDREIFHLAGSWLAIMVLP